MLMRPRAGFGSASGGSGDARRFWRVYISSSFSAYYAALLEVQIRSAAGGPNMVDIAERETSALASSYHQANYPAYAFDGGTSANWYCAFQEIPAWIGWDFGAGGDVAVNEVVITGCSNAGNSPKSMRIDCSDDGSAWEPSWEIGEVAVWQNSETRTFTRP